MTLCSCGCGKEVSMGRKFIWGHNRKSKKVSEISKQKGRETLKYNKEIKLGLQSSPEIPLCACGCSMKVTKPENRYIKGHALKGQTKETSEYCRRLSEIMLGSTKETNKRIKKISETLTGRTVKNNEGRRKALESYKKYCQEHPEYQKGENNPNWKGGISFEPYCSKFDDVFKEFIREKFGRKCFVCGTPQNGYKLCVHHVNYDKECLCKSSNCEFVPLCRSCHAKTNYNRVYWENFINEKLMLWKK